MKIIIIIFSLLVSLMMAQVTSDYSYTSADVTATSGAVVANPGGVWSLYHNPSGLADIESISITAGYTNIFNQNFLQFSNSGMVIPIKGFGTFGLSSQSMNVRYLDTNISSENVIGLSQGFHLQKDKNSQINLGYTISYYSVDYGKTAGFSGDGSDGIEIGNQVAFGLDIGIQAILREKHRVGVYIKNINQPELNGFALPRRLDVGLSYTPYKGVVTSLVMEQLFGHPNSQIKGSIVYDLNNLIVLRVGAQSNPNRLGCGFGIKLETFRFDYGFLSHPILPETHQISLTYLVR
jgi:hypothetical protein